MNLFKIAFSNIKKRKSSAISFLAIVVMSTLMLSIALSLLLNAGSFYERKRAQLNASDILISLPHFGWDDEITAFLDGYEGITDYQITRSFWSEIKYWSDPSHKNRKQFAISDSTDISVLKMNTVSIIDELDTKPSAYAFLPLSYKYEGFSTKSKFYFETATTSYEFTVAGFFEDAQLGASVMGVKTVYVDSPSYQNLAQDTTFLETYLIAASFEEIERSYTFSTAFTERFDLVNQGGYVFDYETARMAHTMFALIMSFVLIIVAAIVLTIALIIVRFNINNNISEDMKSLGALKSIGFTSRQIILSIILQFLMLAALGSLAGALIGGLLSGYVGNIVTATSGLLWSSASFFVPALLAIVAICGISALITLLTANKSKRITPIIALRSGIETHSFKKNYAPLDSSRLPLSLAMAVKTFFGGVKNNVTALVVVTLFGFMTVLGFTLHHNFVMDTSAFLQMLGYEDAQIQLAVYDTKDIALLDEIAQLDGVESLARFNNYSVITNGNTFNITVWNDISQKRRNGLIEGRYPIHDNEITLLASTKKVLKKGVNDMISIEFEGKSANYLVVGISQGASSDVNSDMTLEGFKRLKSDAALKWGFLYLTNTSVEDIDSFIGALKLSYGNKIAANNLQELIESTLVGIRDPIAIVTYLVVAIDIATIVFVFFLLVSTIIRRKNKELGIMKALGFTTKQLITQILLSFLPSIIIGLLLGTLLGALLTNPILGMMFTGLGIAKAIFAIPAPITTIMQFVILLTCLLTIALVALKIKKIAPQRLITE